MNVFLVARYTRRNGLVQQTTYLQGNGTFGPRETATRFVSTTAAGTEMERINVGQDALNVVEVRK